MNTEAGSPSTGSKPPNMETINRRLREANVNDDGMPDSQKLEIYQAIVESSNDRSRRPSDSGDFANAEGDLPKVGKGKGKPQGEEQGSAASSLIGENPSREHPEVADTSESSESSEVCPRTPLIAQPRRLRKKRGDKDHGEEQSQSGEGTEGGEKGEQDHPESMEEDSPEETEEEAAPKEDLAEAQVGGEDEVAKMVEEGLDEDEIVARLISEHDVEIPWEVVKKWHITLTLYHRALGKMSYNGGNLKEQYERIMKNVEVPECFLPPTYSLRFGTEYPPRGLNLSKSLRMKLLAACKKENYAMIAANERSITDEELDQVQIPLRPPPSVACHANAEASASSKGGPSQAVAASSKGPSQAGPSSSGGAAARAGPSSAGGAARAGPSSGGGAARAGSSLVDSFWSDDDDDTFSQFDSSKSLAQVVGNNPPAAGKRVDAHKPAAQQSLREKDRADRQGGSGYGDQLKRGGRPDPSASSSSSGQHAPKPDPVAKKPEAKIKVEFRGLVPTSRRGPDAGGRAARRESDHADDDDDFLPAEQNASRWSVKPKTYQKERRDPRHEDRRPRAAEDAYEFQPSDDDDDVREVSRTAGGRGDRGRHQDRSTMRRMKDEAVPTDDEESDSDDEHRNKYVRGRKKKEDPDYDAPKTKGSRGRPRGSSSGGGRGGGGAGRGKGRGRLPKHSTIDEFQEEDVVPPPKSRRGRGKEEHEADVIECPVCCESFPREEIEVHASGCEGPGN